MIEENKERDWTFLNENTREYTHIYHDYPARMIPQIPRNIIKILEEKEGNLLFDPYCGSGSSLVEGLLAGLNVIGTDINPLAKLISEAKTEYHMEPIGLSNEIDRFVEFTMFPKGTPKIIEKENLEFWFKPNAIQGIGLILRYIGRIKDKRIRKFFEATASETIRESSNTRKGEFKLYRYNKEKLKDYNPDPFAIMKEKLFRNFKGYDSFHRKMSELNYQPTSKVYLTNTVDLIPKNKIREKSIDIVITSPPYGDSHTTVAYGQYSKLSSQWLGILSHNVDTASMGGKKSEPVTFGCEELDKALREVDGINPIRSLDVYSFYSDLRSSINNVSNTIKNGGYACYVVANRKVAGVSLPTDKSIVCFFEKNGFEKVEIFLRSIPNKRMPSKNSPSNIAGRLDDTMTKEYIILMRKD